MADPRDTELLHELPTPAPGAGAAPAPGAREGLAPIALFAFRRPGHVLRTLESLARSPGFDDSALHVFCDGPRGPHDEAAVAETRAVVHAFPHPRKTVVEAPANRGLAASVTAGVGRLVSTHGRAIVVEDDLVVAPGFLPFLNQALDRYADDLRVMQVSAHQWDVALPPSGDDAVLLPFVSSWGWATWQRAWQYHDPSLAGYERLAADRGRRRKFDLGNAYPFWAMLRRQRAGRIDSWAIAWYLSVFDRGGLVVYPKRTFVRNEGFDGSGTHTGSGGGVHGELATGCAVRSWPRNVDIESLRAVADHLRQRRSGARRILDWLRRLP